LNVQENPKVAVEMTRKTANGKIIIGFGREKIIEALER